MAAEINQMLEKLPLVIIDPVKGCSDSRFEIPEWGLYFSKVRAVLPKINSFAKKHRDNGGQIIWVKPVPWVEKFLPENINKLYNENPDARFYVEDYVDVYSDFPDTIAVESSDIILEKNSYSAFVNPKLSKLLSYSYLIAGVYADGCVNATIIDGWSRGFFTYIISDLVESMDTEVKQVQKRNLLSQMWPLMYGHVIKSSDIYPDISSIFL